MTSQRDVAIAFARGADPRDIPAASNFRAAPAPDDSDFDAFMLSYGWAVVFGRLPSGEVVEFTGWRGYSPSTSTQMGKARRAIRWAVGFDPTESPEQPVAESANRLNWRVRQVAD